MHTKTQARLTVIHWNLDSIAARDNTKISLIEAYNSVFNYDLIAISDARLDRSFSNEDIQIGGFCCDVFHNDHPSDTRFPGGVCLYYKENIPIRRRNDLEILQETIVTEISLTRKKVFFMVLYRHPNQYLSPTSSTFQTKNVVLRESLKRPDKISY